MTRQGKLVLFGIVLAWGSLQALSAAQRPQEAPATVPAASAQAPLSPMGGDYKPAAGPLMTRWAKDVSPTNALNEYPRPQMVRAEWANLNGLWEYAIVGKDAARPQNWDGKILVPFPIESALSGVRKTVGPDNRLWYRRTFEVPAGWSGRRVLLHFGAVDWDATAWLNGKELGGHQGGYDGFGFDVTDALKPSGQQELVVAVRDPSDAGSQARGKQVRDPKGIWYTPTTGIWQTVWMEPVSPACIRDLRITPDVDNGAVAIEMKIDAAAGDTKVDMEVLDGGNVVQTAFVSTEGGGPSGSMAGSMAPRLVMKIPDAKLWSPDSPHLYGLRIVRYQDGKPVDEISSYFGMRKISIAKDSQGVLRLMLNNQFVFQVGPLDQGFWPDGLYTAATDEALRYDIEVTKKLGFNMARKHVKVEPARWYYWCDRLGLLVWQDMPSGNTAPDRPQFQRELTRLVEGLYNHPCIVMWVVFNEGWGQKKDDPDDTKLHVDLVRKLDSSRLINNASGWTDHQCGDVIDMHNYPGPGCPAPDGRRACVLGEFGGLGLPMPGNLWQADKNWGYRSMGDRDQLTHRYVELLRKTYELKDSAGLCAAVYTQTTDVEIEVNGLMTYDRAIIKPDAEKVAAANRGEFPPPPVLKEVVPTSEKAGLEWRYTTDKPGKDWFKPDFNDASWKKGPGGFGTESTPGAVVRTPWKSGDIWLRREFTLPEGKLFDPQLRIHHDEDAEVYVNGVPAGRVKGFTQQYELLQMTREGCAALKPGRNLLAVHCTQTRGGQYIDVGVVDVVPREGGKK